MGRKLTFAEAITEAMFQAMEADKSVICYGLGVDDPKGVFSTTLGLQEKFGKERVFDIPSSENAMTGVAIGAGLRGFRSVMTHQRLDFFLLAMDQLVNGAAKWHYMFSGQHNVPITIRLIIGRGWGQGPTHSQSLQSWFAHIPGLKVVMPSTPRDAKGLLLSSIFDNNPVIFLEHRWLHNQEEEGVPEDYFEEQLGKAKVIKEGKDLTVVGMSWMTIEALSAVIPIATLLPPVFKELSEFFPSAILQNPEVRASIDCSPIAILHEPVVTAAPIATFPIAILTLPVVPAPNAFAPIATLPP